MNQKKPPHISQNTKVSAIECPAFELLSEQHKLYAYYFSRASWAGAKICYFQRSFEAPGLFYIFYKIFQAQNPQIIRENLIKLEFTEEEIQRLFVYISTFFQNCGNFLSFGDTKFIPELSEQKFEEFIKQSQAYKENQPAFDQVWAIISNYVYNYEKPYGLIDLPEKGGVNSYYSSTKTFTKEFIEHIDQMLHTKNISELNTRIIETENGDILINVASIQKGEKVLLGEVDGKQVYMQHGEFSSFLTDLNTNLIEAQKYGSNDIQKSMITDYVEHFDKGNMEKHKDSQKLWIQDKGPIIETNIGFIETYLDPMKVRAEFEGFVALVNLEESKILANLVDNAEKIIPNLPWGKDFEIEKFSRPDFTSLEVLSFASSGTPCGINIPNYDDVRQNLGFKNVNLGNAYGKPNRENIRFIEGYDVELFMNYYKESLFVVVALHELIGHGSGKLFAKDKDGKLNYENVINPFTNQPVTTYYELNEHWHAKFGELSGAYEECKADAVALYLSTYDDIVQILLPGKDLKYRNECVKAAWLEIIVGAMKGLQYYSVDQQKWGQPHILASYVIFSSIQKEDPTFIKFKYSELNDQEYFTFTVDYEKIWTVGKKAIGDLLKGLQIYKTIADAENGMKFFNQFTGVDENMKKLREMVLAHKTPRSAELQPEVQLLENGSVKLINFPKTHDGVIESHIMHYQGKVEDVLQEFLNGQQCFKN